MTKALSLLALIITLSCATPTQQTELAQLQKYGVRCFSGGLITYFGASTKPYLVQGGMVLFDVDAKKHILVTGSCIAAEL